MELMCPRKNGPSYGGPAVNLVRPNIYGIWVQDILYIRSTIEDQKPQGRFVIVRVE